MTVSAAAAAAAAVVVHCNPQGLGAGDILMSLVGTALTGLAFVIYKHRASISLPAVAGTALVSSVFSVMATMGASNILGVSAGMFFIVVRARCSPTAL
jgi:hypothetical protein